MRLCGLTVDNLLSVDVVLSVGRTLTADENENADLFWALRGGGGNFGIATSFTYRLHPVGPEVFAGHVIWAPEDAPRCCASIASSPRAPPRGRYGARAAQGLAGSFLPVELHRRPVCTVAMTYFGDPNVAERALAPMRTSGAHCSTSLVRALISVCSRASTRPLQQACTTGSRSTSRPWRTR